MGSRKSIRIIPFPSQKTVHITLPTKDCILNFFFDREFMLLVHGLLFWLWLIVSTPCLGTSNDARNCHLQPQIGSRGPNKLACGVLSVSVWPLVGPTWCKLWDITTSPSSFPTHWKEYSAPTQFPGRNLVQLLLLYHQYLPLTSWANIIKQEALLSDQPSYFYSIKMCCLLPS